MKDTEVKARIMHIFRSLTQQGFTETYLKCLTENCIKELDLKVSADVKTKPKKQTTRGARQLERFDNSKNIQLLEDVYQLLGVADFKAYFFKKKSKLVRQKIANLLQNIKPKN